MDNIDEINAKLDRIIELLEEQTLYNRREEEPIHKAEKTDITSFEEIGSNPWELGNCVFFGFQKKEIVDYLNNHPWNGNYRFCRVNSFIKQGDIGALITNLDDNDILILDFANYCRADVGAILEEVICDETFCLTIGKGLSAQSIQLDLPNIHFILISNYENYISNELLLGINKVYQKVES